MDRLRGGAVVITMVALMACTAESPAGDGVVQTPSPADVTAADITVADVSASELRLTLETQLGHHAVLVTGALRADALDDLPGGPVADRLGDSADRLGDAVAVVVDDADDFARRWRRYSRALIDHGNDSDAALGRRRAAVVELLAEHTGDLTDEELTKFLSDHADLVRRYRRALGSDDYATAYRVGRDYYADMFELGRALATAITRTAAGRYPGNATAAATEVRSALTQLLGEHTDLLVHVVRRGAVGADDFEQAAAALNGNTEDLAAAMERLLQDVDTATFEGLWRDRISYVVDFTVGVAEGNARLRRRAATRLERSNEDVGGWIVAAAADEVDHDDAVAALTRQARLLRRQIRAFDQGKQRRAIRFGNRAYRHSAAIAALLGDAITVPRPEEFPTG